MTDLALRFFGTPQLRRDKAPLDLRRRKTIALLAYLAVTQRTHSRDTLAALLWPDYDQASARANLRRNLSGLNRGLGDGWLSIEREQLSLPPHDTLSIDVVEFRKLVARSESCRLSAIQAAVDLYGSDFLAGFSLPDAPEFELWQTQQTESLRRDYARLLERLTYCHANASDYEDAVIAARRWLELDPLHEPAQRTLIQLLALTGDRAAAIRQAEACRQVLRDELGVEPEAATIDLTEQILTGEISVSSGLPFAEQATAPFNNLPEQPTPFIGRTRELEQIRQRLADAHCRLLTIVGPGGMGKTRLAIQAAQENQHRFRDGVCFVDLTTVSSPELLAPSILHSVAPGEHSDANARRRLADWLAGKQMLLVLDNFEHLIDGVDMLPYLLRTASDIAFIVTSRQRLNLREEWLEPLDGLAFPLLDQGCVSLEACDPTHLFDDCVRRIRPNWEPCQRRV